MLGAWSDCLRRIRQLSVRDARLQFRLQSIHNSAHSASRDSSIVLCSDCLGALAAKLKLRTLSVTLVQVSFSRRAVHFILHYTPACTLQSTEVLPRPIRSTCQ